MKDYITMYVGIIMMLVAEYFLVKNLHSWDYSSLNYNALSLGIYSIGLLFVGIYIGQQYERIGNIKGLN